jgi:hypothetical protein
VSAGVGGGSGGAESAGSSSSSSLIGQVWCRSAAVSLKVYTKPTYGPHSYTRELSHMRHEPLPALNTQVFARLHAWRDETARKVSGRSHIVCVRVDWDSPIRCVFLSCNDGVQTPGAVRRVHGVCVHRRL